VGLTFGVAIDDPALSSERLAVHGAEPTSSHQLGDAAGVRAISLNQHGLERGEHVTRLEQFHR
jgi:hypothetical protein